MNTHRIITHSCAVAAVALALLPAAAQAGSVLSGYGGPGEGSQAVLGSALIGGPRGGSGGSRGGGGGAAGSGSSQGSEETSSSSESSSQSSSGSSTQARDGSSSGESAGGGAARGGATPPSASRSAPSPAASPRGLYPAAERVPAGSGGTVLGLTSQDLLYVILAAVILVLLGLFTRRTADPAGRARTGG
jgi:hypothetical protein